MSDAAALRAQAIALAGALAEAGVTRLTLTRPGAAPAELSARTTDLPGLIAACPAGSHLHAPSLGLHIEHAGDRLLARDATSDAARAIAALL